MSDSLENIINAAVAQIAVDFGVEYVKNIKAEISRQDKLASGKLYDSINYNVWIDQVGVHLEILSLDYLKWVDAGRKPGKMPPVDAILKWIQVRRVAAAPLATVRRNKIGKFSKGFKFVSKRGTTIVKQQTSLAWAIAMSIKKKGIKPANILKVNNSIYGEMQNAAINAAANAATIAIGEDFANEIRESGLKITTTY